MSYIDGLPRATVVNTTDLIPITQGSTGVPGSGTTVAATASQFNGGLGAYMPLTGGTFTGNVSMGTFTFTVSALDATGGTIDGTVIGGTTPAAAHVTSLSASGTVSGAGFVNWLASPPAIGGTMPAAGAFTTLSATGLITPAHAIGVVGTNTNDNVQAGSIGEYISQSVGSGSAVSLTTGTAFEITGVTLTAGDWDVSGNVVFQPAGSTVTTNVIMGINAGSATMPTLPAGGGYAANTTGSTAGGANVLACGPVRISLSVTTVVYLMAESSFTTSTSAAYGFIGARRAR